MALRSYVRLTAAAFCLLPFPTRAIAQGAGILRPSKIADSSRTLSVQPELAGFHIGEATSQALPLLKGPLKVDTLGSDPSSPVAYANPATGITLYGTATEGIGIIMVTSRAAGDLDGIRVGDSLRAVTARWGPPAAGGAHGGLWLAGDYVVTISCDDGIHVTRLGIGVGFSQ